MGQTRVETNNALTRKAWEEQLFRNQKKESFFDGLMGDDVNNIVQTKRELQKKQGDKITFGIIRRLQGAGVTSGQQLKGNEEELNTSDCSVTLEEYAHAVAVRGPLDLQRPIYDIPSEAKSRLKDWGAEKIDQLCFDALGIGSGAATANSYITYKDSSGNFKVTGTASTAKSGLHATNSKLDANFINAINVLAETGTVAGTARTIEPLRPVKIKGKKYLVLLVAPEMLYDLKTSTVWRDAVREARERAADNPLFERADAVWDNTIILSHENCYTASDGGGGSVRWGKGALLGAQSLLWAWSDTPHMVYETDDYERKKGWSWQMMSGVARPVFDSVDFGSIGVYLSATNLLA